MKVLDPELIAPVLILVRLNICAAKAGLVTVGAGNSGAQNTCANPKEIITASATDSTDTITSWSNYGSTTDISAPGQNIGTTLRGGGYGNGSGTSASCVVAAGVLAL